MSPFNHPQAIALVLDALTAHKRLNRQPISASPEILSDLLRSPVSPLPSIPSGKPTSSIESAPVFSPKQTALASNKAERLAALQTTVLSCTKCPSLVTSRTQVVFGAGNPDARLMLIGEAPDAVEDLHGEPFPSTSEAGLLLHKMIGAMGLRPEDAYVVNILKCRPGIPAEKSDDRKPTSEEIANCLPWLREQIDIIRPEVIVTLGGVATEGLLGETAAMGTLRARWHDFAGIPVMATYHPAYLIKRPSNTEKRKVWEDLLMVMEKLALPISKNQRAYFTSKN